MRKLFALLCVCATICSVYSAVGIIPKQTPPPKYEGQPGCYNEELDIMLPVNQMYSPDNCNCVGYLCQENGDTQIQSCGVLYAPGCVITEDLSLPYPDCCKKANCSNVQPSDSSE